MLSERVDRALTTWLSLTPEEAALNDPLTACGFVDRFGMLTATEAFQVGRILEACKKVRSFEVADLRGFDQVTDTLFLNCFVLLRGPLSCPRCSFSQCDFLTQWGDRLLPAELGSDAAGNPVNPLTLGATGRRLLAHLLPSDLAPAW